MGNSFSWQTGKKQLCPPEEERKVSFNQQKAGGQNNFWLRDTRYFHPQERNFPPLTRASAEAKADSRAQLTNRTWKNCLHW